MQAFDKAQFTADFDTRIKALAKAEKTTKAELLHLSRTVLEAHHETEDVQYVNKLIGALSPINKRAAVEYFKVFSGFTYDEASKSFTKKDKKRYDEAKEAAITFLEDPLNNIWTWAERNLEVEAKEFTLDRLKKQLESTLKKADGAGITQAQVLEAMMEAGLKLDTLLLVMDKIEGKEVQA